MKKTIAIVVLTLCTVATALAQHTVSGTVTDLNGEPLAGVAVMVQDSPSPTGTTTDLDGTWSLSVSPDAVLEFSSLGYRPVTVNVNGRGDIDVSLEEDREILDEVVVVGFATQKRINLTGSVSTVDSKAFESVPVQNAVQALQGKIPGLHISSTTGQLNSKATMQVRGLATIGEGSLAQTLVLIDGMEGDLYSINQQDIESITVLKDAAASSIYGSRAPFGVILVTTKKGKEGKATVNYNNSFRFSTPLNLPQEMDSYTWATFFNDAARNSGRGDWIAQETMQRIRDYMDGKIFYNTTPRSDNPNLWNTGYSQANDNIDYYDVFYKDVTFEQEHNLSVSGGTDKINYYVSANYLMQDGKMNWTGDGLKRYNLAGKLEARLSRYATLLYNARFTRSDYHQPTMMTNSSFFEAIGRQSWPIGPLYDPNGFLFNDHVLRMKDGGQTTQSSSRLAQQVQLTITPLKGWRIIADFNYRYDQYFGHQDAFQVSQMAVDGVTVGSTWWNNWTNEHANRTDYININAYSDYEHTIGRHYFKVMAGFQAENNNYRNVYATINGILTPSSIAIDTATGLGQNGAAIAPQVGGGYTSWSTAGFFGRLNYNYDDRYMVEANFRYDGSSRFRVQNRWGFFPSFSAGWNIANEPFFTPAKPWVDMLKLRGSYGLLGNQYTDTPYPTYSAVGYDLNAGLWLIDGKQTNISWAPELVSMSLSWEKIYSMNIGIDFALFRNRLTGSFDYFIRQTKDMVGPAEELPVILGTAVPVANNTDLETKGWELEIGWRDQLKNGFAYGVNLVLFDSQGTITRYSNPSGTLSKNYAGKKWGEIWGYETIGIAKTQEEMDAHLATLPNGGQTYLGMDWAAGDIMYADLNNDGKVDGGAGTLDDHGDRRVIGNTTPRYNFGIDITMEYKGFDFRLFLQGTGKRDSFQGSYYFWGAYNDVWWSMGTTVHEDYFRDNPDHYLGLNLDSYYPRPLWGTYKNLQTQTRYLQNAAYLRIKNVQLGYTIPPALTKKIGIDRLRIFFSGENLATFTKMIKLFDPETIGTSMGNSYPLSRTWSFGLSVTL